MIWLTPLIIKSGTTKKTKYSHKHFSDYLSNESSGTILLQPKTSDPNCILYRILFLLKNEISK